jgi:hypothetical protein
MRHVVQPSSVCRAAFSLRSVACLAPSEDPFQPAVCLVAAIDGDEAPALAPVQPLVVPGKIRRHCESPAEQRSRSIRLADAARLQISRRLLMLQNFKVPQQNYFIEAIAFFPCESYKEK